MLLRSTPRTFLDASLANVASSRQVRSPDRRAGQHHLSKGDGVPSGCASAIRWHRAVIVGNCSVDAPGSTDTLVLDDLDAGPNVYPDLARLGGDGTLVWRAVTWDARPLLWLEFWVDHDVVVARSWSCYLVHFDLATGAEVSRIFAK